MGLWKTNRNYIYVFTLFRTLRQYYTPSTEAVKEDKILKYWVHQTIPEIIALADELFEQEKYFEVYELLNRIRFTRNTEILWRISRALFNLSQQENLNNDVKWEMIDEAYAILEIALSTSKISAEVHKWMAIVMDRRSGLVDLEERVRHAEAVRDHLIRACELNPRDFTAHYMLGRWCFQMCQFSWLQRMIAKYVLHVDPPKSSYQQAYKYLSKAEELQPRTFLPAVYLLGRTCVETGQYFKAKYYLNLVTNLPPKDNCEMCCISNAKRLIKRLEKYDITKNAIFYEEFPFAD